MTELLEIGLKIETLLQTFWTVLMREIVLDCKRGRLARFALPLGETGKKAFVWEGLAVMSES